MAGFEVIIYGRFWVIAEETSLECLALLVSTCKSLEPLDNRGIRYKRKQGYPSNYSPQKSPQSVDAAPSPVLVS
jgi:hypothetical protein